MELTTPGWPYATYNTENTASVRVLEHLGFKLDGRLRDNEFFKSRWWDSLVYSNARG